MTGQSPDPSVVEIQVGDIMRFTPSVIAARPGERVRVVLKDVGGIPKAALRTISSG